MLAKSSALMCELSRTLTVYPRTVSANWDLCLHILFTRNRLVPILHLEWYLNHNSTLTQQSDSNLMESFSQVCMQNAVLGIRSFLNKHPHDVVKRLGLSILGCLSLCENQFISWVFFAYSFFPNILVLYQCKMRLYHFLFEIIQFKYIIFRRSLEYISWENMHTYFFNEELNQMRFQSELYVLNKKLSSQPTFMPFLLLLLLLR